MARFQPTDEPPCDVGSGEEPGDEAGQHDDDDGQQPRHVDAPDVVQLDLLGQGPDELDRHAVELDEHKSDDNDRQQVEGAADDRRLEKADQVLHCMTLTYPFAAGAC